MASARGALQQAALAAFAERGFEGASTRWIAELAGVPQGLVRHHFGSKEGLFRDVVEQGLAALAARLEVEPAGQGGESARPLARVALEHSALLQLLVHALLEPGPRRDWLVAEHLHPLARRIAPRVATVLGRPRLDAHDGLALAGALLGPLLLAPLVAHSGTHARSFSPELLVARGMKALTAGPPLAARSGPWAGLPQPPRDARR